MDHKVVGPAFRAVAARYRGQAGIEDQLVAKVRQGGAGGWGVVAMPANTQVSDAQAHALVHWVLQLH